MTERDANVPEPAATARSEHKKPAPPVKPQAPASTLASTVPDHESSRLITWSAELRAVHSRLRRALDLTRQTAEAGASPEIARDLLIFCRGFCAALGQHHRGEDRSLFPAIEAAHPDLAPVLRKLEQDHSMMDYLIVGLDKVAKRSAPPEEITRHLDGLSAIMDSHFAYEERQLLTVLDTLALDAEPGNVLGEL